ncbi:MAG: T9SS type A sorting domain-containing protein [Calditrichaeota bacterium]|nr:T9SS type A sorting domain-containing protein [Calditrichota bacterium]
MKSLRFVAFLLIVFSGSLLAQINLPTDGLVGHWKIDDPSNLGAATVGNDLVALTNAEGGTPQFFAVNGPSADNGAAEIGLGTYLKCAHNILANGPEGATSVNQYSFVIDFHLASGTGKYYAFYSTDPNINENDAESFIEEDGGIGPGSLHMGDRLTSFATDTVGWYRMVVTIDLGDTNFYANAVYYLDGQLWGIPRYLVSGGVDGKFALSAFLTGSNVVNLFGDNDGEDAAVDVAEVALYDRKLSVEEVKAMGGYGHVVTFGFPVEDWEFDNPENPFLSSVFYGNPIAPVGDGAGVVDGIVSVDKGSYLEAKVDIGPRGGENVNMYSIEMDAILPQADVQYTLLQTDTTNLNDAVLKINARGQIGSDELGWSSDTLKTNEIYRIFFTVSPSEAVVYLDGSPVLQKSITPDGALSLVPGGKVLFFADNDGEDSAIKAEYVRIYNLALNAEAVQSKGGYEHYFSSEKTPAGKAMVFNAALNQYGYVPYSSDFDIPVGGKFTVEMWMKTGPYYGDPAILGTKDWSGGSNPGWIIYEDKGQVRMRVHDADHNGVKIYVAKVPLHRWAHVGIIVDTTKTTCFVNDVFLSKDNSYQNVITSGLPLAFAQDPTYGYDPAFNGSIDEVRIWKTVLSEKTLKEWRHKPITTDHPNYSDLVGYWKFDNVSGDTVKDLSPEHHDIILVNSPSARVSYVPMGDATMQKEKDIAAIWGFTSQLEGEEPVISNTSDEMTISSPFQSGGGLAKKAPVKEVIGFNIENYTEEKYAIIGNNGLTGQTAADVSGGVQQRFKRVWYFDMSETFKGQSLNASFKLNLAAGPAENYVLLVRNGTEGTFMVAATATSVQDSLVRFEGIEPTDSLYVTLGTLDATNAPLGTFTGVDKNNAMVYTWELSGNYPNPFNPSTTIAYSLREKSDVQLTVYNTLGQKVATILDIRGQAAGKYKVTWQPTNLGSGIYFYHLKAGDFVRTRKMTIMK